MTVTSSTKHHYHKWTAALERLKKEGNEDFGLLNTTEQDPLTVLSDILKATTEKKDECIKKRWKVTIKGRTIILRVLLEKIAKCVDKLVKFGDIAVQYDPVSAALPWAAVRMVLQATVNDVETFGYMLESIENVTNVIAVSYMIERHFLQPEHSQMDVYLRLSDAVVSLYAAILQYLFSALQYYSKSLAIRLLKSIVVFKSDLEAKYSSIENEGKAMWDLIRLAEIEKSKEMIVDLRSLEDGQRSQNIKIDSLGDLLREFEGPIRTLDGHISAIHDGLERDTRARILTAISTVPYKAHHKASVRGRLEGSGTWLFQKEAYDTWLSDSYPSVLWLHGIPGCGKTKLTSLVIDELQRERMDVAYFYCARDPAQPARGQCDKILASFVRQLASQGPDRPILHPIVQQYEDAIAGFEGFEDQCWDTDECKKMLLALTEIYPAMTLVLDGLDEVCQQDRQELMDTLSYLLQESQCLLKVFISSRDNYDIALHLDGSPNVYIEADDNAEDIVSFIEDQLNKARLLHNKLSGSLRSEITDTLIKGARGMFRWVELQIQVLRRAKVAGDIKARLGTLPETLEGSYWEIYQDILTSGEYALALANFTFQWLLYSKDSISIKSFAHVASSALPDGSSDGFSSIELMDVCSNLITVRGRIFEFAHLSVREFFEGLGKRNIDTFVSPSSNALLAGVCIRYFWERSYMCSPDAPSSYIPDYTLNHLVWRLTTGPRSESVIYAARYWVVHVHNCGDLRKSGPLSELIRAFVFDTTLSKVSRVFEVWCAVLRSASTGSAVISCKAQAWEEFAIISRPVSPIWLACTNDWFEIVELLYEAKCEDIVRPEADYRHEKHVDDHYITELSPLSYAIKQKNATLVDCILECTMEPMEQLSLHAEPLLTQVVKANDPEMLKVLLKREHGGLHAEGQAFRTAAFEGYHHLMEILLSYNSEMFGHEQLMRALDQRDLLQACELGHVDVAALLIDHNIPIPKGETVLFHAVLQSQPACVELLLDRGIGLSGLDAALTTAISQGDTESAHLLLNRGAKREDMAVVKSILSGLVASTVRLICAGFDTRGHYLKEQRTALHFAAKKGSMEVIHALLEDKVAVDSRDSNGRTPLHVAAEMGHHGVVQLLLDHGSDMLAKDKDSKTPLDLAESGGRKSTVDLLRDSRSSAR